MVTLTTTMMVVDEPNITNDAVLFSIIGGGLTMKCGRGDGYADDDNDGG